MHIRSVRTLLFALVILCTSAAAFAQVGVMITIAPPAIPVYEQPICPGDGYIWTPGYWAWGDDFDDYYWVPGTWIEAPEVGFLWTPGFWAWNADRFVFTDGYWGPHVGFYGGIDYGFGYFGNGYEGGRWDNGHFFYNRAVTRVNVTIIHNVYNTKVVESGRARISYNGGNGGINARPTPEQETAMRERHVSAVAAQTQHLQAARSNSQQRAAVNRGKPEVAATAKPGEFSGRDVVKAKKAGGAYTPPPANRGGNPPRENATAPRPNDNSNAGRPNTAIHPGDLPRASRAAASSTGNAKLDQKYQQQQQKQSAKQDQERQKLQQKQEKEHQQLAQQNANDARKQQVEQKHQQQTQQLQQRHEQQQQKLQTRQQPPAPRAEPKH